MRISRVSSSSQSHILWNEINSHFEINRLCRYMWLLLKGRFMFFFFFSSMLHMYIEIAIVVLTFSAVCSKVSLNKCNVYQLISLDRACKFCVYTSFLSLRISTCTANYPRLPSSCICGLRPHATTLIALAMMPRPMPVLNYFMHTRLSVSGVCVTAAH